MDKIIIKNLKVFTYHGVHENEKLNGQEFILDITAYIPLNIAGKTDSLEDTVSYAKILKTAVKVLKEAKYNLLEKVAVRVVQQIFSEFSKIEAIEVCLKKPQAPISANFDYVGVDIFRKRGEV